MNYAAALACLLASLAGPARAQSATASQASALSLQASVETGALAFEALAAGSHLVVTGLRPLGEVVEVSVEIAGRGASVVLRVAADVARHAALAVGGVIVVTAASAGVLLSAGGAVIAFIPNELARAHLHHREL
jgi:hypothetical protein